VLDRVHRRKHQRNEASQTDFNTHSTSSLTQTELNFKDVATLTTMDVLSIGTQADAVIGRATQSCQVNFPDLQAAQALLQLESRNTHLQSIVRQFHQS
jgi:hypothetical protein